MGQVRHDWAAAIDWMEPVGHDGASEARLGKFTTIGWGGLATVGWIGYDRADWPQRDE